MTSNQEMSELLSVCPVFRVICVYFASKFDKNANLEIKIYKIV